VGTALSPLPTLRNRPEHLVEKELRAIETVTRKCDGFDPVLGIVNQSLLVQPVEHVPIESLPRPIAVVQGQIEQRQRRIVDLICVDGRRTPRMIAK
jgi:hypothetical protein